MFTIKFYNNAKIGYTIRQYETLASVLQDLDILASYNALGNFEVVDNGTGAVIEL